MELSKRLQAVADMVVCVGVAADVGTDHGYIPIYLIETHKCKKVIAMDINEGPLLRASEHITERGLGIYIETRQSDGVAALAPFEVQTVVLAGMGGGLMIRILEEGKTVFDTVLNLVLQPQSEIGKVRKYLIEHGYRIEMEDIVKEDGKFYPLMQVVHGLEQPYNSGQLQYGRVQIQKNVEVWATFVQREIQIKSNILNQLQYVKGSHIELRVVQLREEQRLAIQVLEEYESAQKES